MKDLVLISCSGRQEEGERILQLAQWMGVMARKATLGEHPTKDYLVRELGGDRCAVVLGADTLTFLRERLPAADLQDFIEQHCTELLVFSVRASEQPGNLFDWLTNGAVHGLAASEAVQSFRFPDSSRPFSGPFCGQSFLASRATALSTFALSAPTSVGIEPILLANERPIFLRMQRGACELFLIAADEFPDIHAPLDESRGLEAHYGRLIPLLIFLRHSFGDMCWHGVQKTARLIIDDPLLDPAYGCLSYSALRQSMRSASYATSIAFIPWNHWRTSKAKAARILGHDQRLSICVHGCDHTNREFDDRDPPSLEWKAATALRRMERHELRTGVPFDPVMVFPQGKFASPALRALRTSGYLAAVNTKCFPTNAAEQPIAIADLLRPAIMKFDGFPIFQRRYPQRLIDFALDVFLGRPVLLVQHHDDFRDGYETLEAFVHGLHKLEPSLTWPPLAEQLMQSCITKSLGEGSQEVRFVTREFRFKSSAETPTRIVFSKEEPDAAVVSSVLVDGTNVSFSVQDGLLTFEHWAKGGQVIDVTVQDRARHHAPAPRRLGVTHTIGVCARRALSELRDKTLVKHPRLMAAATAIAKRLKVTGETGRQRRL